jgi:hypothetical protein
VEMVVAPMQVDRLVKPPAPPAAAVAVLALRLVPDLLAPQGRQALAEIM